MKNKRNDIFFFSIGLVVAELFPLFLPFFDLHYNPMEPYQQNNWRTA